MCEKCGYSIDGLPGAGSCPECGRPVAASLPAARAGTPWQRSRTLGAWVRTNLRLLAHPSGVFGGMSIERRSARAFGRLNIAAAAAALTLGPAVLTVVQLARDEAPFMLRDLTWPGAASAARWTLTGGTVLGLWICAAAVLWLLTTIESWGIRSFGRVHRSRITPTIAALITAHATAGWLAGGLLGAGGYAAGLFLHERAMHHNVGDVRGAFLLAPALLPMLGAAAGLLWFEAIVYVGVAGCRFANRTAPRAGR